jgi:hypothetical protein
MREELERNRTEQTNGAYRGWNVGEPETVGGGGSSSWFELHSGREELQRAGMGRGESGEGFKAEMIGSEASWATGTAEGGGALFGDRFAEG